MAYVSLYDRREINFKRSVGEVHVYESGLYTSIRETESNYGYASKFARLLHHEWPRLLSDIMVGKFVYDVT